MVDQFIIHAHNRQQIIFQAAKSFKILNIFREFKSDYYKMLGVCWDVLIQPDNLLRHLSP